MPTYKQLKVRTEYLINDTIDDTELVELFNECFEDLAEVAGYGKLAEASFYEGDPIVSLPSDFVEMIELKIKTGDKGYKRLLKKSLVDPTDLYQEESDWDEEYSAYERFDRYIELFPTPKDDGKLKIRYYATIPGFKPPTDFPNLENDSLFLEQTPGLKTQYHRILPLFAAMRYSQNYKDVMNEKQDFQAEYQTIKNEIRNDTQNRRSQSRSSKVYQHRSWI